MKERIEVVWPLGKVTSKAQALAPRLDTLEGKTICGLSDGLFHFEETWPLIAQLLSRKYPGVKLAFWEESGLAETTPELLRLKALPCKLREHGCDAVISGRGC